MITSISTIIIVVSIIMMLNGKEGLYLTAILLFCIYFPALAFIVITLAVLSCYSD